MWVGSNKRSTQKPLSLDGFFPKSIAPTVSFLPGQQYPTPHLQTRTPRRTINGTNIQNRVKTAHLGCPADWSVKNVMKSVPISTAGKTALNRTNLEKAKIIVFVSILKRKCL